MFYIQTFLHKLSWDFSPFFFYEYFPLSEKVSLHYKDAYWDTINIMDLEACSLHTLAVLNYI